MPVQLPLRELHLSLVGMAGSGKSALAVKYITKRFIGDYDSLLGTLSQTISIFPRVQRVIFSLE